MDFHKLTRYVNPKRVLDIGAHVGNFTTTLNRLTPGCEFIMVEANPNCEEYLVKTTHPYEIIALSNQQGKAQLYVEKTNSIGTGASLYRENTEWYGDGKYETVEVELDTLDNRSYFSDELIDLVKLDVQGAEFDILNGGRKTIKRSKYVLIETSLLEYNQGAPLIDQIVGKMKEYEFVIEDILEYHKLNTNQIFQMDILFRNSYIY
jgi:FkbM family methyltransferase